MMSQEISPTLFEQFKNWRQDGIAPLSFITGYAELLAAGSFGELTAEQHEAVQIILAAAWQARECWEQPLNYLRFYLGEDNTKLEPISLAEVITEALQRLPKPLQNAGIEVTLPATLPLVRGNHWLATAVSIGITQWYFPSGGVRKAFTHTITASLTETNNVLVQIHTRQSADKAEYSSPLYYPGTGVEVVKLILERHQSELELDWSREKACVQFTLPVA